MNFEIPNLSEIDFSSQSFFKFDYEEDLKLFDFKSEVNESTEETISSKSLPLVNDLADDVEEILK